MDEDIISQSQWVFAFCETERGFIVDNYTQIYTSYDVKDVLVLRIHFQDVKGDVYNLGVVSDVTSSADDPSGEAGGVKKNDDWLLDMLAFLVLMIGLVFFFSVCFPIISLLGWVLKFLAWFIALPFKLLRKLFRKKKK